MHKVFALLAVIFFCCPGLTLAKDKMEIKLNPPLETLRESDIRELLKKRRSIRNFSAQSLNLEQLSTILWASLGKNYDSLTGATRPIPSAGAIYPLEVYILIGKEAIKNIKAGLYHYLIDKHSLELKIQDDLRLSLSRACFNQDFIVNAPISLIVTAVSNLTMRRYGQRGLRYVFIEAGHISQNIYLITQALGLSTVEVGAFDDNKLKELLLLDKEEDTLIVMPIGYPQ